MQNERGHCHGGAESSLLPTRRTAFFAQVYEGDVEPAGSTLVRIRDARCHGNQKNRSASLSHCCELAELFLAW